MFTKLFLLSIVFLLSHKGFGQNCSCKSITDSLFNNVERNYIDNLSTLTNSKYIKFKLKVKKRTENIFNKNECLKEIEKISKILNDKHVVTYINHSLDNGWKPEIPIFQRINHTDVNSLEGIWRSHNGHRLSITQIERNAFIVVLLDSVNSIWVKKTKVATIKKKAKHTYSVDIISLNRVESIRKVQLDKSKKILDFGSIKWIKITDTSANRILVKPNDKVSFSTDSINYIFLSINSFNGTKKLIDSIILSNKTFLDKIPHLIIDISENQGGTVGSFEKLLPYFYTNKIYLDGSVWNCSTDNIGMFFKLLNAYKKTDSLLAHKTQLFAHKMKEQEGGFLFLEKDSILLDSINKYPKKISLIIGKSTASAAELFTLRAIQSKKVTTYGENTFGACDNLDVIPFELGYNFFINLPIAKRNLEIYKKRIDNVGIPPNFVHKNKTLLINMLKNEKIK